MSVFAGTFRWRLVSKAMLWFYRQQLPWHQVPRLSLFVGFVLGGLAAVLVHGYFIGI